MKNLFKKLSPSWFWHERNMIYAEYFMKGFNEGLSDLDNNSIYICMARQTGRTQAKKQMEELERILEKEKEND